MLSSATRVTLQRKYLPRHQFKKGSVILKVSDEGEGFDHKNVPDPTKQENLLRLGGRGIYIIRVFMDEVQFNEPGNAITMTKFSTTTIAVDIKGKKNWRRQAQIPSNLALPDTRALWIRNYFGNFL